MSLVSCLFVASSVFASSCSISDKKGFHVSGANLCLDNINYPEVMAAKSRLDISSFSIVNEKMVLFTSKSLTGTSLILGTPDGVIKIVGEMPNKDLEKNIDNIRNVSTFNGDDTIYFMTSAWATSNAIHKVSWEQVINVLKNIPVTIDDIVFVTSGNSLYVIQNGKYAGFIVVNQHKYKNGGGSYDTYVLVSPDGKAIKEIGEYKEIVNDFLYSSGTMETLR